MTFEVAEKIANAVLYEGYVLYPYRASATKNQLRWQFGVVVPRGYAERGGSEPCVMQTECLLEAEEDAVLDVRIRYLQAQARAVEEVVDAARGRFRGVASLDVDGRTFTTWDEGVEKHLDLSGLSVAALVAGERTFPIETSGERSVEVIHNAAGEVAGSVTKELSPISGLVRLSGAVLGSVVRLRVRIENVTPWPFEGEVDRDVAMRSSLLGAHTLLAVRGGAFVSLLEPPEWAKAAVASCENRHTWPVLVGAEGSRDVVLSSPIILYDYPAVAPESAGDLCDATEIDEILMLRVMTLTDEEKREAYATDDRARQIIERSDTIPPEMFARLHGAMRSLEPAHISAAEAPLQDAWDAFATAEGKAPSAEQDSVEAVGGRVSRDARVRLHPSRRADAMDMFLGGRTAAVQGVYTDVDGATYVAVTIEDDPAADLHGWYGRYFYFYPEEIELLEPASVTASGQIGAGDPVESAARAGVRVLVACVGNIFLGDDGFGVEVAQRLSGRTLPDCVKVADFGIRGVHLAYELLDGAYDTTVLVDATPRGGKPGTVYLIEPDLGSNNPSATTGTGATPGDAHGMSPDAVFAMLTSLGGVPGRVLIVGCEPANTNEGIGLSDVVASAVDEAVALIVDVVARETGARADSHYLRTGSGRS
jgi:hydrogenase maturation protease